jgi:hypothetical protein
MGREVVFLADTWRRGPVEKASLISHFLIRVPGSSPVNHFSESSQDPRHLLTYLRRVKIVLCKVWETSCLPKDFVDPLSL